MSVPIYISTFAVYAYIECAYADMCLYALQMGMPLTIKLQSGALPKVSGGVRMCSNCHATSQSRGRHNIQNKLFRKTICPNMHPSAQRVLLLHKFVEWIQFETTQVILFRLCGYRLYINFVLLCWQLTLITSNLRSACRRCCTIRSHGKAKL